MSFYGSPRHVELAGDFGVVASLQQQFDDLLFAWTEPNSLLFHPILPFFDLPHLVRCAAVLSDFNSIHVAILRIFVPSGHKESFPQRLAGKV